MAAAKPDSVSETRVPQVNLLREQAADGAAKLISPTKEVAKPASRKLLMVPLVFVIGESLESKAKPNVHQFSLQTGTKYGARVAD